MAWLETPLLVMNDFVGKQKHGLAASGDHFGSLGVGDDCIENYPLLDDAKRHPLVMFSSSEEHIFERQLRTNQGNLIFTQQSILDPSYHPTRPRQ